MSGGNEWQGLTGSRNQRLIFQHAVETVAESGQLLETWETAFETWGAHRDLRATERVQFEAVFGQAEAIFVIRYKSGTPTNKMRILWRSRTYEITADPIELGNKDGWQIYARIPRVVNE